MLTERTEHSLRLLATLFVVAIANASTSRASVTVTDATIVSSLAALDALLPPDPGLPSSESVCATLTANLGSAAFSSPDATDPVIDNAAAVAADPTNSNPDTARIQTALNTCPSGMVVRLVLSGSNDAFLAGSLTLPSGVGLWVDSGVTL